MFTPAWSRTVHHLTSSEQLKTVRVIVESTSCFVAELYNVMTSSVNSASSPMSSPSGWTLSNDAIRSETKRKNLILITD